MAEIKFPDGFLWGVSTAAHQIEGGNYNDWSVWEKKNAQRLANEAGPLKDYANGPLGKKLWEINASEAKNIQNYISGHGVGHYRLWKEDLKMAQKMGLKAFRFSIEWSRIEPKRGIYDETALKHYRQVINECQKLGIVPFVSLFHWTNPVWVAEQGGWLNPQTVKSFKLYCEYIAKKLAGRRPCYWLVVNEPEVIAAQAYLLGEWPPQEKSFISWRKVLKHLAQAHIVGYKAIKDVNPNAQVSSAINNTYFEPAKTVLYPFNKLAALLADQFMNKNFFAKIKGHMDFVGLNHYMHCVINGGIFKNKNEPRSDLGWYLYPQSLYKTVQAVARYNLPVIITEHGLADKRDKYRDWFIRQSLLGLKQAISEGIDVRGYLHWSLLDNFEWDKGYWPKFGLVSVDRKTMKRTLRPSAKAYSQIAKNNGFIYKG